jgi:LDH2 family malate/lactate/ureidoglycolate dehydrogenase
MIGYFVNNSPAVMAPWGGVDAKLGNNPFAYAFPTTSAFPLVIDMACSAVARGKVRRAALENQRIPSTWAITKSGLPTEDAHEAMTGTVLPMGGPKGYALAVVNELLAGALPGALLSFQVSTTFVREGASAFDSWSIGHLAMALDIESFGPLAAFKEAVNTLERELKGSALAPGTAEILLPGERSWRERERRLKHGVPFPDVVLSELDSAAREFDIAALT